MTNTKHQTPDTKTPTRRCAGFWRFEIIWCSVLGFWCLSAATSTFAGKIKYTYDGAGRLTAAELGTSGLSTFLYDLNGNVLNQTTAPATNADVRLTKTSNFTGSTVGNPITYTLTVTNAGPTAATGVTVTDPLPFGVLLSSATAGQGGVSFANRTVTAGLGVLPANGSATVTIIIFHGITNTATNIAMVTAATPDPNLANNTASRVTSGLGPINDNDSDGMPNWWETLHGLNAFSSSGVNGANGQKDADGVRNFDEWLADTDPSDANSFFHIEEIGVVSGVTTLQFQSSPIRRYTAQFTPALVVQPFTNFATFNGSGLMMSVLHTNSAGGFYRFQAEVP